MNKCGDQIGNVVVRGLTPSPLIGMQFNPTPPKVCK